MGKLLATIVTYFLWFLEISLWTNINTSAQTTYAVQDTVYKQAVNDAFAALKQGDCQACLNLYQRAFRISQKSAMSTLRAAVCAHQCGQVQQARAYMQKAVAIDWWISEDVWSKPTDYPEFTQLRNSELAPDFQKAVDTQKIAAGLNPSLERELKQIYEADQKPRLRLDTIGKQFGFKSPQTQVLYDEMQRADSVNLIKIERILQQYGYPGKKLVGDKQNITAWLVIQHAPLAIQEKYVPIMQEAAVKGELQKSSLALLLDRIRIRKGQKQLYGSQVHIGQDGKPSGFEPIEDEFDVNKRRAEMGLSPLEEYAKHWGFDYVPVKK